MLQFFYFPTHSFYAFINEEKELELRVPFSKYPFRGWLVMLGWGQKGAAKKWVNGANGEKFQFKIAIKMESALGRVEEMQKSSLCQSKSLMNDPFGTITPSS